MYLSKKNFKNLLDQKKLVLSLIGMSNIGKTYWSKQFKKIDFYHFFCDLMIEKQLTSILQKLGYKGIEGVSKWMGQPYQKRFTKNQQIYLNLEEKSLKNIFKRIKLLKKKNAVIDTTGSVIHLKKNIQSRLKKNSLIIYIEANDEMRNGMFKKYILNPKPVVFGTIYNQNKGETKKNALENSYQKLLKYRSTLYKKLADITIPRLAIKRDITAKEFLTLIKDYI